MKKITFILCWQLLLVFDLSAAVISPDVQSFIMKMSKQHGFSLARLNVLFSQVQFSEAVLKAISHPAEQLPWYRYRPIFVTQKRAEQGVVFWEKNKKALERVVERFGVPAEIIVAIIGVETFYGKNTGGHQVLDALATLAFNYPRRGDFFQAELEHYLLLTQEQGIDPLSLAGSYAGAMGIPQFISSSYRNYAIDFNDDGRIDIWSDAVDAIGSVANYLKLHGWQRGQQIVVPARSDGKRYRTLVDKTLLYSSLQEVGVNSIASVPNNAKIRLLEFDLKKGTELWIALDNFHTITKYNHSTLYAMAVYQLANEIKRRYLPSMY